MSNDSDLIGELTPRDSAHHCYQIDVHFHCHLTKVGSHSVWHPPSVQHYSKELVAFESMIRIALNFSVS